VTIRTARDCTWAVSANAPWIGIVGSGRGQGDGAVDYIVSANPVPVARSATISIEGVSVQLNQAAAPPPPPPPPPAPPPPPTENIEVRGRVSNLGGSCPTVTFFVAGRFVLATEATAFRDGRCPFEDEDDDDDDD
jgi:hypothetical protein